MPELPEVEILTRHLGPWLNGRTIRAIAVRRAKILEPTSIVHFTRTLRGAKFSGLRRRGKYLLFDLRLKTGGTQTLLGHLGMTGRMYLLPAKAPPPKHAAVVLNLGADNFIFEDARYFGRLTLDTKAIEKLGPEPLEKNFTNLALAAALGRSSQAIKIKLLDQSLVAGVGNIYASEALFRARISPCLAACRLQRREIASLRSAIRKTLMEAIRFGSTVPLNFSKGDHGDKIFYYGLAPGAENYYDERLMVYDRAGKPCRLCGTPIRRIVQAARSTFFCPLCQKLDFRASNLENRNPRLQNRIDSKGCDL